LTLGNAWREIHSRARNLGTKVNLSNSKGPALEFRPRFLLERRIT